MVVLGSAVASIVRVTGNFGDTVLSSSIPSEYLPDKFNQSSVRMTEEIGSSFDPDRPIRSSPVEFSGTAFAEFQFVTEDFVKTVAQKMLKKSCDLDPIPTPALYDCWMKLFPL